MASAIYKKINEIKAELSTREIKKSGKNSFAKYDYMELGDFLPVLIELMSKYGVMSKIDFTAELATLTLFDVETGESVTYTSPMSSAELKGVHAVQNLGAVQTYLRRYLLINAFDIVERDMLDASVNDRKLNKTQSKPEEKPKFNDPVVRPLQDENKVKRVFALAREVFPEKSAEDYKESIKSAFNVSSFTMIDNTQLDKVISGLEKKKTEKVHA